ncbi:MULTISPECIES: glycosyltransferase family 2 protein [unclassified Arthrobacter]|uniref:glycosyltransferase family 2 protein n=1 Tax=unclassified Arthrobacter TaxID=235627 RepID=UPI0024DF3143|nr:MULTISPECIES: glycosyltransferase family 2 protein [unclassified Arthrobacter]MCC9144330.1 glycosyltransferase [Arthrobacter sp. zg-Y919]MDK1275556.1 glycosyltransferase family 2 protein [Arthrobacter sp. zg.Y919]WIB03070.1 glycosyltransferase family 2 protein [Arthrobacter sp. zg-Y919]
MTRRWSGDWALPPGSGNPADVDVLIPTRNRPAELAVTLAGLAAQDGLRFDVVISDQSTDVPSWNHPAAEAMVRVLQAQGRSVRLLRHLPARGLAEQRHFLLGEASAPLVLFLDDDVWLEPEMLVRLTAALAASGAGFVGAAVQGLSYLSDRRPEEQQPFQIWEDNQVQPERIRRGEPGFSRWTLHNAANLAHIASGLGIPSGEWQLYRIAWVGACVLYDREALLACGGFGFWDQLPSGHAGEDVAAQWRVMERFGGAGMVPSGAVHLESPTTVTDRSADAAELLLGAGTDDLHRPESNPPRRRNHG